MNHFFEQIKQVSSDLHCFFNQDIFDSNQNQRKPTHVDLNIEILKELGSDFFFGGGGAFC